MIDSLSFFLFFKFPLLFVSTLTSTRLIWAEKTAEVCNGRHGGKDGRGTFLKGFFSPFAVSILTSTR